MKSIGSSRFYRVIMLCVFAIPLLISSLPVPSFAATQPAVCCSYNHSLALKADGTVWAWGNNKYGQLGTGLLGDKAEPVQVKDLEKIKAIAARDSFSYALAEDDTLFGWGRCGNATPPIRYDDIFRGFHAGYDSNIPVIIPTQIKISTMASNPDQFCAYQPLANTMVGYVRGYSDANRLHQVNFTMDKVNFVEIIPLTDQRWIARDNIGQVWSKGDMISAPTLIKGLSDITSIAGASGSCAALKSDGTVWTWGNNGSGQLGDGTKENRITPEKVPGLENIQQIAAAGSRTMALKKDGTVYMWGLCGVLKNRDKDPIGIYDYYIQVVRRYMDDRKCILSPEPVSGLSNIQYIACGDYHCLAIKDDGTVWAWGYNDFGELGDGTTINRAEPVMINDFNVL